ncbi:DUF4395 domain-containing protein [Kitasatospora aureofaciens]|uniref:DUF4395 domain-containing protein n=1 Tax=Kitasatospora aureofaciens TaxID=1894 RepID=UPI0037F6B9FA
MQIDPRGPRFAAVLTSLVLAAVLITGSEVLLALQAAVFALAAIGGLRLSPYGWLYRTFVRPRLAPPTETEDERPPRFAQGVGLVFAVVGTLGFLTGVTWLGLLATAFALAAAFLNAVFGYCLGCEMYLLIRRAQGRLDTGA